MKEKYQAGLFTALFLATAIALPAFVSRGCNMAFNNRDTKTPAGHMISRATGFVGHVEYAKYNDGSSDLKVYPGFWGHRLASSRLYQDLDGDGKVDRIRVNGPEWQYHKLKEFLTRQADYNSHKIEFDEADELLLRESRRLEK